MPYILAHDLGTTGNKATLFDERGGLVAARLVAYPVAYPQAGWAEQDPIGWWQAVCTATRALIAQTGLRPADIAAVTFSGQMMGTVPIDAQGDPLRTAIIWADQRAVAEADFITERCGSDLVYRRTGHRISPAYLAAKILWVKRHQPDCYRAARRFLCAKDFVAFKLTGRAVTDYSDASGSNLFDLVAREWRTDLIEAIGLDADKLPEVHASTDIIGSVTRAAGEATGLQAGTPVVIGGGDGACAGVGAGAVQSGDAYAYIGSSAWISFVSNSPVFDPQQRTFTFHHLHPQLYAPMGTMQAAGGARDWLVQQLGDVGEAALAAVPPGANGLIALPYLIGERSPWWNPQARGAVVGLTMNHSRAELARAMLEGVSFNLRLILAALESQGAAIPSIRLIGGGAQNAVWRQILADVLARPVHVLELITEATSWGAAVAGGVGVGLYPDWAVARDQARIQLTVEPDAARAARYAELLSVFAATYRALAPIYERLR